MDINKILEQGEKEILKKSHEEYRGSGSDLYINTTSAISILKSQQHKLLQSIVEMIDSEKLPKITRQITCPDGMAGCLVYHFEEIEPKENQILEKLKAKLTINIKE